MTAQGVIEAVPSRKNHVIRGAIALVIVAMFAVACSSSEPSEPASASPDAEETQTDNGASADDDVVAAEPDPTMVPEPGLADELFTSITTSEPGGQVEDAQGNRIAIYGVLEWPQAFDALSDTSHAGFPFSSDIQNVADPQSRVVVLDVGMCAAGINVSGFGTAEFFVNAASTDALPTDPILGREMLARHPVVRPGFSFPSAAECTRGWLPILWSGSQAPAVARYVLDSRSTAGADVERHVYEWQLDSLSPESIGLETLANDAGAPFAPGQTVTFNEGPLGDTTVVFDGWSELIGAPSPIEGTRMVGVLLDFCPASQRLPEFGLGVDGWNIIAPLDNALLGATEAEDKSASCYEGWLEFAVPFGAVPTAFFASDGVNPTDGYAEWSLANAALSASQ